jgi:hypothetical protein
MDFPDARFFQLYAKAELPQRATRNAYGTLPTRAVQYCEAITSATSFGWSVFSPVDCMIKWDGMCLYWKHEDKDWIPIDDAVAFPGPSTFYQGAPAEVSKLPPPPFLIALPEAGTLQVSLGIAASCSRAWALLLRGPANWPMSGHIEHYEGIIDPAVWFGPLFINLRITKTDTPIRLCPARPLAQIQPILRSSYSKKALTYEACPMGPEEWEAYERSVAPTILDPGRPFGDTAIKARQLQKSGCPMQASPHVRAHEDRP